MAEIALVEDEVQRRQQHVESFTELGGHRQGDLRVTNLALGAHDSLRQGRLGNEERTADLAHGQSGDQLQGQRHLCVAIERRVTAQQHQPKTFVGVGVVMGVIDQTSTSFAVVDRFEFVGGTLDDPTVATRRPDPVDRTAPRCGHQPAAGIRRHSVTRPGASCVGERIVDGIVGKIEISIASSDHRQHAWRVETRHACECGAGWVGHPIGQCVRRSAHASGRNATGRTSSEPLSIGIAAASSSALSRSSAEMR